MTKETGVVRKQAENEVDSFLLNLSEQITTSDKLSRLGVTLNFMNEEIQAVREENGQSIFDAAYQMLKNWQMRICQRAILDELKPALKQCQLGNVLHDTENEQWFNSFQGV